MDGLPNFQCLWVRRTPEVSSLISSPAQVGVETHVPGKILGNWTEQFLDEISCPVKPKPWIIKQNHTLVCSTQHWIIQIRQDDTVSSPVLSASGRIHSPCNPTTDYIWHKNSKPRVDTYQHKHWFKTTRNPNCLAQRPNGEKANNQRERHLLGGPAFSAQTGWLPSWLTSC